MDSRDPFIKEVAKTINERHGKESGSFIFGISGRWGEGKTYFLNKLREELCREDDSFQIFGINPWKFSVDRLSFLRNFLRVLYGNDEGALKDLDIDISEKSINWKNFTKFLFILGAVAVFAHNNQQLSDYISHISSTGKFLWTVFFIPVFMAIIQAVTTSQETNHAITALDKFDDRLTSIIHKFNSDGKKTIIFVDDLDRVTAEMARDVLDNLRTFFDKPEITFVVTGDHGVLEGYLGRQLLPNDPAPAQAEEGRRFLKKIFNVYWRLPLPIKKEVDNFIQEQFSIPSISTSVNVFFPEETDKDKLRHYLATYFDSNYRQIIRFLDTVLFTFKVIKQGAEAGGPQRATYFEEMLKYPLLVVRILMIQELCTPLFEKMVTDVQTLLDLEYAVEKKDTNTINAIIDRNGENLSRAQKNFISRFIYEEPRFFKESCLQVQDLQPFLSLAADASFGDQRGPSGDDFWNAATAGDPNRVKNSLLSMGEKKAIEGAKAIVRRFPELADQTKIDVLNTLSTTLAELPVEHPAHQIFAKELVNIDYGFLNAAETARKMDSINTISRWLDKLDKETSDLFKDKFVLNDVTQFRALDVSKSGVYTSSFAVNWLKNYYSQNQEDALNLMAEYLPRLGEEEVKLKLGEIEDSLGTTPILDNPTSIRDNRYFIARNYLNGGKKLFKDKVMQTISSLNGNVTQWAISKTTEEKPLWSINDIEESIINRLTTATDYPTLILVLRFAIANKIDGSDTIWSKGLAAHMQVLIDNLPQYIDDASLEPMAPPESFASQLMDLAVEKIKTLPADQQAQWIGHITKGKWLWINLNTYPFAKKLAKLKVSAEPALKTAFDTADQSWSLKQKS